MHNTRKFTPGTALIMINFSCDQTNHKTLFFIPSFWGCKFLSNSGFKDLCDCKIRYPVDPYDRIWRLDSAANYIPASNTSVNITNEIGTLAPIQVLQTAVTHPERLEYEYRNLDAGDYDYVLYLHFFELNGSVQAGQRVFDIYINDERQQEVDILANGSPYSVVVTNFTANGVLNLTLAKALNSQLGPICNAYEIFRVYPTNQETDAGEGIAHTKCLFTSKK